jgi:hypothetical protein
MKYVNIGLYAPGTNPPIMYYDLKGGGGTGKVVTPGCVR